MSLVFFFLSYTYFKWFGSDLDGKWAQAIMWQSWVFRWKLWCAWVDGQKMAFWVWRHKTTFPLIDTVILVKLFQFQLQFFDKILFVLSCWFWIYNFMNSPFVDNMIFKSYFVKIQLHDLFFGVNDCENHVSAHMRIRQCCIVYC